MSLSRLFQIARQYSPHKVIKFIYHLPSMLILCWRLMNDKRVPYYLKLLCWGSILYFFMPFDLLRDFGSLYLGRVDDILILYFAFSNLVKNAPPEVVEEHVQQLRGKKPKE